MDLQPEQRQPSENCSFVNRDFKLGGLFVELLREVLPADQPAKSQGAEPPSALLSCRIGVTLNNAMTRREVCEAVEGVPC